MFLLVSALLGLIALDFPAHAQSELRSSVPWEAAQLPDVKPVQVELKPDLLERFTASLPALISMARDLDREQGSSQPAELDDDLALLLAPYLFDAKTELTIRQKLAEFGFASYQDWANVAHSVSLATEASEFTGSLDLAAQETAARQEIEKDAQLPPDEKARALEEVQAQFSALAAFEPLPGNREAIAPYLERLRAATGG